MNRNPSGFLKFKVGGGKVLVTLFVLRQEDEMIGDSNEEVAWDGFEFIRPDDPRYFDSMIEDLRCKGCRLREDTPEESKG